MYLPNAFLAIMCTSFALKFIRCWYKSVAVKIIHYRRHIAHP